MHRTQPKHNLETREVQSPSEVDHDPHPQWFASQSANFFVPLDYFSEKAARISWLTTDEDALGSLRPHIGK